METKRGVVGRGEGGGREGGGEQETHKETTKKAVSDIVKAAHSGEIYMTT